MEKRNNKENKFSFKMSQNRFTQQKTPKSLLNNGDKELYMQKPFSAQIRIILLWFEIM